MPALRVRTRATKPSGSALPAQAAARAQRGRRPAGAARRGGQAAHRVRFGGLSAAPRRARDPAAAPRAGAGRVWPALRGAGRAAAGARGRRNGGGAADLGRRAAARAGVLGRAWGARLCRRGRRAGSLAPPPPPCWRTAASGPLRRPGRGAARLQRPHVAVPGAGRRAARRRGARRGGRAPGQGRPALRRRDLRGVPPPCSPVRAACLRARRSCVPRTGLVAFNCTGSSLQVLQEGFLYGSKSWERELPRSAAVRHSRALLLLRAVCDLAKVTRRAAWALARPDGGAVGC